MIAVRHANSRRRPGQMAGLALIMVLLSSCASTMPSPDAPSSSPGHPVSALNQRWVKVETNPPTWYPRGTPADCSTDYRNGDWIYTENAAGTRFFIPRHGLATERRAALIQEAQAARDLKNIALRDQADDSITRSAAIKKSAKAAPVALIKMPLYAALVAGSWLCPWGRCEVGPMDMRGVQ